MRLDKNILTKYRSIRRYKHTWEGYIAQMYGRLFDFYQAFVVWSTLSVISWLFDTLMQFC